MALPPTTRHGVSRALFACRVHHRTAENVRFTRELLCRNGDRPVTSFSPRSLLCSAITEAEGGFANVWLKREKMRASRNREATSSSTRISFLVSTALQDRTGQIEKHDGGRNVRGQSLDARGGGGGLQWRAPLLERLSSPLVSYTDEEPGSQNGNPGMEV